MRKKFESNGCVYDVEIFNSGNKDIIRFYEHCNEEYGNMLRDLVVATPSYGFLLIQHIDEDAVLTGTLNREYFCEEMLDDILYFTEENISGRKD